MVYEAKTRILHTGVYEEVFLTPTEHKLLLYLSSEKFVTYNELEKNLNVNKNYIKQLKSRLEEKTNFELKIDVIRGLGYRLKSEIYFE